MRSLEIDGKKMHSIKYVSLHTGYSPDYVTRLAREQKIIAAQVGRRWFVDMASVQSYVAATAAELTLRKQQLSEERKRERRHEQALQDNRQKQALRKKQHTARTVQIFATSAACVLLVIGVLAEKYTSLNERITQEVAQVLTAVSAKNSEKISNREIVAPTEVEVLDFSQESVRLTSLNSDAVHEGILVLPSVASAKIPDLFSDDVTVVTDTHGQPHIVRLDEAGTVVEKVPYVVVPVKQNQP